MVKITFETVRRSTSERLIYSADCTSCFEALDLFNNFKMDCDPTFYTMPLIKDIVEV